MITIKKETLERIKDWNDSSIYILADFDRTITTANSHNSWSVLSKSDMIPKEYIEETQKLYEYYRPFEIDESLDYEIKSKLMNEWWNKHIGLFIKYKLSKEALNNALRNSNIISFREGTKEFLENMRDRNIPVIIISAGIGNVIKESLIINNCNLDNIYIVSNFIKFENGIATGISDNIIHSLNKNEVALSDNIKELIKERTNIILLGDAIADIRMAKEESIPNALKIGFLETNVEENKSYFEEQFDIICTNNTNYNELSEKICILKK